MDFEVMLEMARASLVKAEPADTNVQEQRELTTSDGREVFGSE